MPRRLRALFLLAALALAAGLARTIVRCWPRGPARSWIEQDGVPVELAGDGVYFLTEPATVGALLARAAHPCGVAPGTRPLTAGDRVTVDPAPRCAVTVERMTGAARLTLGLRLDVNHDDETALAALPTIGPGLARAIVRERTRHGRFDAVDDLPERVRGLGPATLRTIRHLVEAR